jgi:hypothetical protein
MRYIVILILALFSMSLSAQFYSKDLEKRAKKGETTAQYETGLCYLKGLGITSDRKKAAKWLQSAAEQNHAEAMYELALISKEDGSADWKSQLTNAANLGSANAQYALYKETNEKDWLVKAATNRHADALYDMASLESDSKKKLEWLDLAASNGHNRAKGEASRLHKKIEKEEEEHRIAEEEKRLASQMKEIEEGRLLPSLSFVRNNITGLKGGRTNSFIEDSKLVSICKMDVLRYTDRENSDALDRKIYEQSEQYKIDLNSLMAERDQVFALICEFDEWYYPLKFTDKGFEMEFKLWSNSTNIYKNHMGRENILFPVQPSVTLKNDPMYNRTYFFSCSDLMTLKKIKDRFENYALIILFKPGFAEKVNVATLGGVKTNEVAIVNPISMYVVDEINDNVLVDLSYLLRDVSSKSGYESEMAFITKLNKDVEQYQKQWEREYNERLAKIKYHQIPREVRCWACAGSGKYLINDIPTRCKYCYGRGYILEHYY